MNDPFEADEPERLPEATPSPQPSASSPDPAGSGPADGPGPHPGSPELTDSAIDERFAALVAAFDDTSDDTSPRPADRAPGSGRDRPPAGTPSGPPGPSGPPAQDRTLSARVLGPAPPDDPRPPVVPGWRVHTPPPEPDEGFVPPPPAPLPGHDLGFWAALGSLLAGPIWIIYLVVADPVGAALQMWLAIGLIVGGAVLVFRRLPRDEDVDPDDDGARI